jgi:hypothetical protein
LSLNTARRKPTVNACETCSRELQIEGVYRKNDREEKQRRQAAQLEWLYRLMQEPARWRRMLSLPAFALKVIRLG